jgi:hypothetical protein
MKDKLLDLLAKLIIILVLVSVVYSVPVFCMVLAGFVVLAWAMGRCLAIWERREDNS